jgi:hypothetical protein
MRLLGIVAAFFLSVPAFASECIGLPTATLLNAHDAVFTGVVTEIRLVDPEAGAKAVLANPDAVRYLEVAVTVKVTEAYTSAVFDMMSPADELVLHQWAFPGSTDYWHHFEVGHPYLVFASRNTQPTRTSLPTGLVSRGCDAWDLTTPAGRQRLKELEEALH